MTSRLFVALLIGLMTLAGGGTATALDDTKPVHTCGLFVKDSDKDADEPNSVADSANHPNMEIKGFFLKHEEAKGAEATTVNIVIKDLSTNLPDGNTAINWSMKWEFDGGIYFVRAVADYTGMTAFEWGEYIATGAPAGVSGTFQYRGTTPGKLFEGPDGVVQLVIPQDIGGKSGSQLSTLEVSSNTGKSVVPVVLPTPSRGVAYENDGAAVGKYTVGPCAPPAPAPVQSTPPTSAPGAPSATTGPGALPVKLSTRKVKRPKKKSLALKLKSSEKITGLVAQLRSKNKTVAKGKLGSLNGKGTLKLKLSKKLKKGKYTLDLAGRDAAGQRRSTSAALTVR